VAEAAGLAVVLDGKPETKSGACRTSAISAPSCVRLFVDQHGIGGKESRDALADRISRPIVPKWLNIG
jgi:hypothetical protein